MNSNIKIIKLTEVHGPKTLDILKNVFFKDEQMLSVSKFDETALQKIYEPLVDIYIKEGLSFVAINSTDNEVIGIQLNTDFFIIDNFFVKYILPFKNVIPENWALTSIYYTESAYKMNFQKGDCIHLLIGAVKKEYRRQGILKALLNVVLSYAKLMGFKHAISECTGQASSDALSQFGFVSLQSVIYKDFVYEGRKPFESLEGASSLMYKKLFEQ